MSALKEIADYIAEGLSVIPIVRSQKVPDVSDWTTRNFTLDDFTPEHGVAIRIDQGMVDIDLDCPEAAIAAGMILPETRQHGRPSNPGSHFWYRCPLAKSLTFKDLDGTMLLEARTGSKQYTILPPSIHPSGENYQWANHKPMLKLEEPELILPLRASAIATLFGRHWPEGNRHHAAAHLAGFLLRCGFDSLYTVKIVQAAAMIGEDEELQDRIRAARDTAEKHMAGGKTTGAPKLKEVFEKGEELARRVRDWLDMEGDDILDEFNEKHFVTQIGGKNYVVTPHNDRSITTQAYRDFVEAYYNKKVGKVLAGEWWLKHPARRSMAGVAFAPPPLTCHDDVYNTWNGFSVEPDPNPEPEQRCRLFLEHLFQVICGGSVECFHYLLDWCAMTCQRPGETINVAVVLRGGSGAGKGTFASNFGKLFGSHFNQITHQSMMVGRFNSALSRKVVIFADEAMWAGSKQDAGNLKRLVTEGTLMIEQKYREPMSEPNCVHLIMATNEEWVWPAMFRERRGFILDVKEVDGLNDNRVYFDAIYDEWDNGGAEAFLALCLARQTPRRLGPVPVTEALIEQQELSMDPVQEWWLDRLAHGEVETGKGWPKGPIPIRTLSQTYAEAGHRGWHSSQRGLEVAFGKRLRKLLPHVAKRSIGALVNVANSGQPRWEHIQCWAYHLPTLDACRKHFDKITGAEREWDALQAQIDLPEGEL